MRFAQMLLNQGELEGARILGRKTAALMYANHAYFRVLTYQAIGD